MMRAPSRTVKRTRRGLATLAVVGVAAGLGRPAFAQNAATIPVAVQVVDVPAFPPQGVPADRTQALAPGQLPPPGQVTLLGVGLAALRTETIEPDRVRVRLEYVAN
jgi:hypothetical protein